MRITSLISKKVPPAGSPTPGLEPGFPDREKSRAESDAPTRGPAFDTGSSAHDRLAPGLSSPHPLHPRFTAISWVVLQEVKSDAATALLRLELLRRHHPDRAIARAIEFLRCAVGELDGLASGETDGD